MTEIVNLYDNLTEYNGQVSDDDQLSIELVTHPLLVRFWCTDGDIVKECNSFQSANRWIRDWIDETND